MLPDLASTIITTGNTDDNLNFDAGNINKIFHHC